MTHRPTCTYLSPLGARAALLAALLPRALKAQDGPPQSTPLAEDAAGQDREAIFEKPF